MSIASIIYLVLLLAGITLLVIYSRAGKLFRCVLFTASTGFVALGVVWILSRFTGLDLNLTPLSALVSGLLGVPGVLAMLVMNLI